MIRFSAALSTALALVLSLSSSAQTPYVVTTLSPPVSGSSNASQFTMVGDAIYFYASQESQPGGIWKWTEADGARLVRSTPYLDTPGPMLALGNKLVFSMTLDSRGRELWITDGTSAGTTLVKDIYPAGSSSPVLGATVGGKVFFAAYDVEHGRELWITDGTEAGTMMVKDLDGSPASSAPMSFTAAGSQVYFNAADQLWVSDGTEVGTIALASSASSTPAAVLGTQVLFLGADSEHGRELWSSDGTPAGTAMLKDINPGSAASWGGLQTAFVQSNGALYFFAEDAANGRELWKTDGTEGGTQLVKDITVGPASSMLSGLSASQSGVFFLADNKTLWFTDGTGAGTLAIRSFTSGITAMTAATNGAFIVTPEPALYFSNGTGAGTARVSNVTPVVPPQMAVRGASVVFVNNDPSSGREPWISDGTAAGTKLLADVVPPYTSVTQLSLAVGAGSNFFFATGNNLMRNDGTAQGTVDLGALNRNTSPYTGLVTAFGNSVLFNGGVNTSSGLWKTDGTLAGTALVKPFAAMSRIFSSSAGYALVVAGETTTYTSEFALWRTDGTAAGTTKLLNRAPTSFVEIAGRTYFLAGSQYYSELSELWRTDGTDQGTHLIGRGRFGNLAAAAGSLYVVSYDTDSGSELWRSDGTGDRMTLVKDIKPGNVSSAPENFIAAGNFLYFTADDGIHGRELWRTDGTEAGTVMLTDVNSSSSYGWYTPLVAQGRYVYFTVDNSTTGDLWRSDGTIAGTIRLTDTAPSSAAFRWLTPFDGRLLSVGYDAAHGRELWESDGTSGGTFLLSDLVAGAGSGNPQNLTLTRDRLFFVAEGGKLWAMNRAATRIAITDRRVVEGSGGSTNVQFTVTRSGSLTGPSTVSYFTEDITATAGSDYQANSGMLSFSAGESSKQITVAIVGDTTLEKNEFFAVNLNAATGATIVTDRAICVIEEDDRKVALSLALVPRSGYFESQSRVFLVTNSGNAGATVTLKVSESPFEGTFSCDGKNPSRCAVGTVPAGESVEFVVTRSPMRGTVDPAVLPGATLTATVSALEAEDDLSDNTIARMIGSNGLVSLPSMLVPGTTAMAYATSYSGPGLLQLSMSGPIVVSPGSVQTTQANPVAAFTLAVSPSAFGSSLVKLSNTDVMRVPIVMSGEQVKLDASITLPGTYTLSFPHDQAVKLPFVVAGTTPDGILPSGSLQLLNSANGSLVQTQTLDAEGKATFSFATLPVGTYQYSVAYAGDANFNPLKLPLAQINVTGWGTYTSVAIIDSPCGDSDIVVTVTNGNQHTPVGTVRIEVSSVVVATLELTPTGTAGTATATLKNFAFSPSSYYASVSVFYVATGNFSSSSGSASRYNPAPPCPAPTLIATPSSATSVALVWSPVGAAQYEVLRAEAPARTSFTTVGTTAASSFTDTTASTGKAYLYKINAKTSGGVVRSTSATDVATVMAFTNDPVVAGTTVIKAVHMTELQIAATALRNLAGLPPVTFSTISAGSTMLHSDFTALRTGIQEALTALGYSVNWLDPGARGSSIRAVQLQQLRNVTK